MEHLNSQSFQPFPLLLKMELSAVFNIWYVEWPGHFNVALQEKSTEICVVRILSDLIRKSWKFAVSAIAFFWQPWQFVQFLTNDLRVHGPNRNMALDWFIPIHAPLTTLHDYRKLHSVQTACSLTIWFLHSHQKHKLKRYRLQINTFHLLSFGNQNIRIALFRTFSIDLWDLRW